MIRRNLTSKILELFRYFQVVSVNGPRQSGKTTLIRHLFSDLPYVSLESPDDRLKAEKDPRRFLDRFGKGAIIDEAQRIPDLFSYIQGIVDNDKTKRFILSGSENFLLNQSITQSLAGRVGIVTLLPLSMKELETENLAYGNFEDTAYHGFYPALFDKGIPPKIYFPNYLQTYVERDVRQIKNIGDLNSFMTFMKLCAGRSGQLLNYTALATDAGISVHTAKAWLSVLGASYIVFLLHPHHRNFRKRLVKMPKLYFYDTGLLCHLLGIEEPGQLQSHFARGAVFENLVIAEMIKHRTNEGQRSNLYFWRNHRGDEIDCIIENGEHLTPVEIKSGQTLQMEYFKGIDYWNRLSGNDAENSFVVYGGSETHALSHGKLVSWRELREYPQ